MTSIASIASVAALCLASTAMPATARAADEPMRVHVGLQIAAPWGGPWRRSLSDEVAARLRNAGMLSGNEQAPAVLRIVVDPADGSNDEAIFDVVASANDSPLSCTTVEQTCVGCSFDTLHERVLEHVDGCIDELTTVATPPEASSSPKLQETSRPATQTDAERPLSAMGWAGVGLLAAGVGLAVGGAVMTATGERELGGGSTAFREVQNLRPAGIGLLVTAGVALVSGGTLLGLDRRRSKQKRLSLQVDEGWIGLTWSGRF